MYASKAELAEYLFISEEQLPNTAERYLKIASDQVRGLVLDNYDSSNASHVEAMKEATCAQTEYLIENPNAISGNEMSSFSIGKTSATMKDDKRYPGFSKMTINYLNYQGLLYRGAKLKGGYMDVDIS